MSGIIEVTRVIVRIPPLRRNSQFLGYADVELGGAFTINNVRIVRSSKGRVVAKMPDYPERVPCPTCLVRVTQAAHYCHHCGCEMPTRPDRVEYRDIVHPIRPEQRAAIERAVLIAYANADTPPLKVVSA